MQTQIIDTTPSHVKLTHETEVNAQGDTQTKITQEISPAKNSQDIGFEVVLKGKMEDEQAGDISEQSSVRNEQPWEQAEPDADREFSKLDLGEQTSAEKPLEKSSFFSKITSMFSSKPKDFLEGSDLPHPALVSEADAQLHLDAGHEAAEQAQRLLDEPIILETSGQAADEDAARAKLKEDKQKAKEFQKEMEKKAKEEKAKAVQLEKDAEKEQANLKKEQEKEQAQLKKEKAAQEKKQAKAEEAEKPTEKLQSKPVREKKQKNKNRKAKKQASQSSPSESTTEADATTWRDTMTSGVASVKDAVSSASSSIASAGSTVAEKSSDLAHTVSEKSSALAHSRVGAGIIKGAKPLIHGAASFTVSASSVILDTLAYGVVAAGSKVIEALIPAETDQKQQQEQDQEQDQGQRKRKRGKKSRKQGDRKPKAQDQSPTIQSQSQDAAPMEQEVGKVEEDAKDELPVFNGATTEVDPDSVICCANCCAMIATGADTALERGSGKNSRKWILKLLIDTKAIYLKSAPSPLRKNTNFISVCCSECDAQVGREQKWHKKEFLNLTRVSMLGKEEFAQLQDSIVEYLENEPSDISYEGFDKSEALPTEDNLWSEQQ